MTNYVKISESVARWLIQYAKQLVDDGFGVDFDPDDPIQGLESTHGGFIDEIPMENGEMWRYMNAVIAFARTVASVLARNLHNPPIELIENLNILDDITNENDL